MPNRLKLQRPTGLKLDSLHVGPLNFPDAPALNTDQMIMMRALKFDLELRVTVRRRDPLHQPALLQHFERAEYGDLPNALASERLVNVILGKMLVRVQEIVDNLLALVRVPEAFFGEVLLKHLVDPRGVAFPPGRPGGEKDQLFGGYRGHILLKSAFNIRLSRRGGQPGNNANAKYAFISAMLKRAGFTLIELMIVVAIIGVLAAMASLQFSSGARKSAEALTKGNLGSIRSAISIYYGDSDGIYPSDDLSCLTVNGKYLETVPVTRITPFHTETRLVTGEAAVTETSGWSYDNTGNVLTWGSLHVGCLHNDSRGVVWSTY